MCLIRFIGQKVWSLPQTFIFFWSASFLFFSCLQVFFPPFILHSHPGNRLGVYALTNWFRAIGKSLPISHEICLLSVWCALFNFCKWSGYSYKWSGYSYISMCTHIWMHGQKYQIHTFSIFYYLKIILYLSTFFTNIFSNF